MSALTSFLPLETPSWAKVEVTRTSSKGKIIQHFEWIHLKSGERYRSDPLFAFAIKCVAIFFATPVYFALYVAWQAARGIAALLTQRCTQIPKCITNDLWCIARAPIFALGVMATLPFGVFFPLDTRRVVSKIAKSWHFDASYKQDLRRLEKEKCLHITTHLMKTLKDRNSSDTCYLAFCFQSLGKINDPNVISIRSLEE